MATGSTPEESAGKPLDVQGDGESVGVPAGGELEGSAFNPLGNPGMKHWQANYIDHAGLEDRGNIFFAAVEMTRMPMVVTDPRQADDPIVFANRAFLDLTLYKEEEVIGRNCRMLQGPDTNPDTVREIGAALKERRAIALDILNYKATARPSGTACTSARSSTTTASCCTFSRRRSTSRSAARARKPRCRRRRWKRSANSRPAWPTISTTCCRLSTATWNWRCWRSTPRSARP